MVEVAFSTFLSVRLFSTGSSHPVSEEKQKNLLASMSDDLAQMVQPLNGTLISKTSEPLVFEFVSNSQEGRNDLLDAIQCSIFLLHRLVGFRNTQDPQEQSAWSFRLALSTISTAQSHDLLIRDKILTFNNQLSDFTQPDQITIDQNSLLELTFYSPQGWRILESESDYGQASQILYRKASSVNAIPQELERKCFQLSAPHLSPDEMFCFYYIGSLSSSIEPTSTPILRLYTPKPLPTPATTSAIKDVPGSQEMVIGKYTLVSVLGVGGMGQVWKAKDTFGNAVALKMMLPGNAAAEGQIERFRREAEIMSKLPHHNICRIFEVGEANSISFISMELVQGITLHELLHIPLSDPELIQKTDHSISTLVRSITEDRQKPKGEGEKRKSVNRILEIEQTLSIIGKMCDAIQFAHDHNILHRDLKPGNIMIREDGEAVVMDFGLGKLETDEKAKDLSLTMSGAMLGTMQYMAPEQAMSSHTVDSRADVYSIGAILYEMVTGQHHFTVSNSLLSDAQKLQDYHPPSPSSYNKTIENDLEMVVMKALHPEPDRRYRTPAALRADLERYRHGEAVTAKPVTFIDVARRMYKRNKPVTVVSFAFIFTLIGFAAYAYIQVKQEKNTAVEARRLAEDNARRVNEALSIVEQQKAEAVQQKKEAIEARKKAERAELEAKRALQLADEKRTESVREQEKREFAEFQQKKSQDDAETQRLLLEESEKEKVLLEQEKQNQAKDFQRRIQKVRQQSQGETDAEIEQLIQTELPPLKIELSRLRMGDPLGAGRVSKDLSLISSRAQNYIEPRLLLGKVHFSNGNFPESFSAFTKVLEGFHKSKDSAIQDPLAKAFFNILQAHVKVDRDFFDETKGKVELDHRSLVESWKGLSKEDDTLSRRFSDPSARLSDADRIAFIKFFSLLEQNP